jgi:hypothetical protein
VGTGLVSPVVDAVVARRSRSRYVRSRYVLASLIAFALVGGVWAAGQWFFAGGRMHGVGSHAGEPVIVGGSATFGLILNSSDGGVVLISARPQTAVPGAVVSFATTDNLYLNVNSVVGDPQRRGIHLRRLRGTRVNGEGNADSVGVAVTVSPRRPGLFRLHDVDIEYQSGRRVRHARIPLSGCVLAYDARNATRTFADIDRAVAGRAPANPLVAQYENDCQPVSPS